ncbi:MAG: hypothetical protein ABIT01_03430 [Thermoanaerobaculia bacterium]
MNEHLTDPELLEHHHEGGRRSTSHLEACTSCRARLEALDAFLQAVTLARDDVPERGDAYGRDVWRRIAPRLEEPPKAFSRVGDVLREFFAPRTLMLAGGVAALVVVAFLAGRVSRVPEPMAISAEARERILRAAVGEHLQRTQRVLLELSNSGGQSLPSAPARAEELVGESRLYRQTALQNGDAAMASLLDDLERLLLEIAHAQTPLSAEERDAFRLRIEKNGVLFKSRILGSRIERAPAPRPLPDRT